MFIAGQQTGSIRYHGGRATLSWDGIPGDRLDAVVAELQAQGRGVMVALEDAELQPFRRRFAGQHLGALDWRPIEQVRGRVRVQLWDTSSSAVRSR